VKQRDKKIGILKNKNEREEREREFELG